MNPMLSTLPTLLVTTLYYFWHVYHREWRRRDGVLRQRVAYMLWVVAQLRCLNGRREERLWVAAAQARR